MMSLITWQNVLLILGISAGSVGLPLLGVACLRKWLSAKNARKQRLVVSFLRAARVGALAVPVGAVSQRLPPGRSRLQQRLEPANEEALPPLSISDDEPSTGEPEAFPASVKYSWTYSVSRSSDEDIGESADEPAPSLPQEKVRAPAPDVGGSCAPGALQAHDFAFPETVLAEVAGSLACIAPKRTSDLVDVSVFGPQVLAETYEGMIQVFLHQLDRRQSVFTLAMEADPGVSRRGLQTLAVDIERGQRIDVILEGRGLRVDCEVQSLVWRGEACACQFIVIAKEGLTGRTLHPRVLLLVDSVPVGSVTFALKIAKKKATEPEIELQGDRARRYHYAFLSYAWEDRSEVIKRAQGLKAAGVNFFYDVLSLEPGERWQQRLYEEIDLCDVFYLFWSARAKASEWVMKETEYALARRTGSENGDPDIIPVIIEGPPPPSPPDFLKDIHFNDSMLYVLAAVKSQTVRAALLP